MSDVPNLGGGGVDLLDAGADLLEVVAAPVSAAALRSVATRSASALLKLGLILFVGVGFALFRFR